MSLSRLTDAIAARPLAAAVLCVAAVVALWILWSPPAANDLIGGDEGYYGTMARNVLASPRQLVSPSLGPLGPPGDKPPLYPALLALSVGAFGPTETALRWPSVLLAACIALLLAGLVRRATGAWAAAAAAAFLVTLPWFADASRGVAAEIPLTALGAAALLVAAGGPESKRRAALAGALLGAAFLCKLWLVVPVGVAVLALYLPARGARGAALVVLLGTALAVASSSSRSRCSTGSLGHWLGIYLGRSLADRVRRGGSRLVDPPAALLRLLAHAFVLLLPLVVRCRRRPAAPGRAGAARAPAVGGGHGAALALHREVGRVRLRGRAGVGGPGGAGRARAGSLAAAVVRRRGGRSGPVLALAGALTRDAQRLPLRYHAPGLREVAAAVAPRLADVPPGRACFVGPEWPTLSFHLFRSGGYWGTPIAPWTDGRRRRVEADTALRVFVVDPGRELYGGWPDSATVAWLEAATTEVTGAVPGPAAHRPARLRARGGTAALERAVRGPRRSATLLCWTGRARERAVPGSARELPSLRKETRTMPHRRPSPPARPAARRRGGPHPPALPPVPAPADHLESEWQFDAADLAAVEKWLRGSPTAGGVRVWAPTTVQVRDLYLDTRDWKVFRADYVLRMRRARGVVEATLKAVTPRTGALVVRRELSQPVAEATPAAVFAAPGPVAGRLRQFCAPRELRVLAEVRTARRRYPLRLRGEEAGEVTLDRSALAGMRGPQARMLRVEVEVPAGLVEGVRPFVEGLRSAGGLAPAGRSKYEWALAARRLRPARPRRLGPDRVVAPMTVGEAAYAVLRKHFAAVLWHEPGTRLGEDPEHLHDMRVGTRRMRAALRLFAEALPAREAERLRRELRALGQVLGTVRDLDVQGEQIRAWQDALITVEPAALEPFLELLHARREAARADLMGFLDSARYRRLTAFLADWLRRGPAGAAPGLGAAARGRPAPHPPGAPPAAAPGRCRRRGRPAGRLPPGAHPRQASALRARVPGAGLRPAGAHADRCPGRDAGHPGAPPGRPRQHGGAAHAGPGGGSATPRGDALRGGRDRAALRGPRGAPARALPRRLPQAPRQALEGARAGRRSRALGAGRGGAASARLPRRRRDRAAAPAGPRIPRARPPRAAPRPAIPAEELDLEILIVRHAIAAERDAKRWPDDRGRPLTAEGVRRFRGVARHLGETVPRWTACGRARWRAPGRPRRSSRRRPAGRLPASSPPSSRTWTSAPCSPSCARSAGAGASCSWATSRGTAPHRLSAGERFGRRVLMWR